MENRIYCKLAKIDSQGYVNGRYFGVNVAHLRLYEIYDIDGAVAMVRAETRKQALYYYRLDLAVPTGKNNMCLHFR